MCVFKDRIEQSFLKLGVKQHYMNQVKVTWAYSKQPMYVNNILLYY